MKKFGEVNHLWYTLHNIGGIDVEYNGKYSHEHFNCRNVRYTRIEVNQNISYMHELFAWETNLVEFILGVCISWIWPGWKWERSNFYWILEFLLIFLEVKIKIKKLIDRGVNEIICSSLCSVKNQKNGGSLRSPPAVGSSDALEGGKGYYLHLTFGELWYNENRKFGCWPYLGLN